MPPQSVVVIVIVSLLLLLLLLLLQRLHQELSERNGDASSFRNASPLRLLSLSLFLSYLHFLILLFLSFSSASHFSGEVILPRNDVEMLATPHCVSEVVESPVENFPKSF